jgi:hypothetical protein
MSHTNSKITKVSVSREVVEKTGLTPETVRKYLRLIESPSFTKIANAYKEAIQKAIDEKVEAINTLQNS